MSFIFKLSKTILDLLIFSFILFVMFYCFCGITVFPEEMAVRQIDFGPYKGISKKILASGRVWNIPHYSKIYKISVNIQTLSLGFRNNNRKEFSKFFEIHSLDGNKIGLEIIGFYRFSNLYNGRGYELLTRVGTSKKIWLRKIENTFRDELKKSFENLSTMDFLLPRKRKEAVENARNKINITLKKYGIFVYDILLDKFSYIDKDIDDEIFVGNIHKKGKELLFLESELNKIKRRNLKNINNDTGNHGDEKKVNKNTLEINAEIENKKLNNLKGFLLRHGLYIGEK